MVSEKVIRDFNFATDALDKSPPHNNNEKICEKWIEIIEKYQLTDKWRKANEKKKIIHIYPRKKSSKNK